MSRKGKLPISVPKGVEIKEEGRVIKVKGPKGQLEQKLIGGVEIAIEGEEIRVGVENEEMGNFQGLYRTLIANMIEGVTEGFSKQLSLVGVGYRAALKGKNIDMQLGFSHPTEIEIPEGINVKVDKNTEITIEGADKQQVGQFAANLRSLRKPEPYKGKGVHYKGEWVRRKAGKAGK